MTKRWEALSDQPNISTAQGGESLLHNQTL